MVFVKLAQSQRRGCLLRVVSLTNIMDEFWNLERGQSLDHRCLKKGYRKFLGFHDLIEGSKAKADEELRKLPVVEKHIEAARKTMGEPEKVTGKAFKETKDAAEFALDVANAANAVKEVRRFLVPL